VIVIALVLQGLPLPERRALAWLPTTPGSDRNL
jgi:hypothetical protein